MLRGWYAKRNRPMPQMNIKQATLIPSASAIDNPIGTAPGWWVEHNGKKIACMPGVPHEMKKMWEEQVAPRLGMGGGGVLVTRTLKTIGIGESNVAELVQELIHNPNPTLATYAKQDGVHLRIAAKAESRDAANSMIADFEEKVRAIANHWVYGIDDETLSAAIGKLLVKQRRKVATMESASGGLLGQLLHGHAGRLGLVRRRHRGVHGRPEGRARACRGEIVDAARHDRRRDGAGDGDGGPRADRRRRRHRHRRRGRPERGRREVGRHVPHRARLPGHAAGGRLALVDDAAGAEAPGGDGRALHPLAGAGGPRRVGGALGWGVPDGRERLTPRVRRVLAMAEDEAVGLRQAEVGTEHVLLALLREGRGLATRALRELGVEPAELAQRIRARLVPAEIGADGPIGLGPGARAALEMARAEAARLHHDYVGTEHLLLGLLRDGEGPAFVVLNGPGVTLARARQQIVEDHQRVGAGAVGQAPESAGDPARPASDRLDRYVDPDARRPARRRRAVWALRAGQALGLAVLRLLRRALAGLRPLRRADPGPPGCTILSRAAA